MMSRLFVCAVILFELLLGPRIATAHPIDNAILLLEETQRGQFDVRFQTQSPALGAITTVAVYPSHCRLDSPALHCGRAGLSGTIEFPWLRGSLTRLVVDIEWLDGSRLQRVVSPETASLKVYDAGARGWAAVWPVLGDYGWLGIEHILFGFDHLCLVVALTLLVKGRRRIIATISAFTLAHSVTLALSVLDVVRVPIAPVEAMIALSIVLLCAECLRPDESLTRRAPWVVAFTFGLLHGFGFASALLQVGLPEAHLPTALLGFNLGVELGQLVIVLTLLFLGTLARYLQFVRPWMWRGLVYAMGSIAAYWSIDRILSVIGTMS